MTACDQLHLVVQAPNTNHVANSEAHLDTTTVFGLFETRRVRARGLHRPFSLVGRLPSAGVVGVSRCAKRIEYG